MEHGCTKPNENIYFACRKEAAASNERLWSREGAAELLGISPSTLANHELGVTKTMPVDTIVMMADLYNAPQLKNLYCKNECPIGRDMPMATEVRSLAETALSLLDSLDDCNICDIKRRLIKVAAAGSNRDAQELKDIAKKLDEVAETLSGIRMVTDKIIGGERGGNGSC